MEWRSPIFWILCVALLMVAIASIRAATCSAGWRVWVCYQITVIHEMLFARCKTVNACPFPETGPAIIVANHTSPVDPALIWHRHFANFKKPRLRVIGFMMAREFYEKRGIIHWVCRTMESIPVERSGRDMKPIRKALKRLEAGHLLGLFPEGRLNVESPDQRLLPGGSGVAWLALKSKVPVIPVFIRNAPRAKSIIAPFLIRTHATLIYGEPIDLSAWYDKKPGHAELQKVTDLIMMKLAQLGGLEFTPNAEVETHGS